MIVDQLFSLSLGVTVRHSDQCDGTVTLTPARGSINSLRAAEIIVTCSKCKTTTISHIARYAADADLLNIADRLQQLHDLPYLKHAEQDELRQLVERLRARGESL